MELKKCYEMAKTAAKLGGRSLRKIERGNILNSSGRDVKHLADLESEKIIVHVLENGTDFPILSEECGEHGEIAKDDYIWVVDPLDGTLNFSQNIKFACVSIALWRGTEPVLGVIYDFYHEELFSGIMGQGSWCNNLPIHPSGISNSENAVLATGFPVNRDFSSDAITGFLNRIQFYKKIRLLGSAALSLAYVACGRSDAYFEEDIMFWDVAAGIALVKAAGGAVSYQPSNRIKWAGTVQAGATFRLNRGSKP